MDVDVIQIMLANMEDMSMHIAVLNDELGGVEVEVARISQDVAWLTKSFWIVITGIVGTLTASIWQIVITKKNGKK